MALEVIPECLGHNYPLFLADKKAKYVLGEMKTAYLSTVAFEMANSEFDQQVLYQASLEISDQKWRIPGGLKVNVAASAMKPKDAEVNATDDTIVLKLSID